MEEEFKRLELEQKWEDHYDFLERKSRTHSTEISERCGNSALNRYSNVKPYDRSIICLMRAKDTDYINANLVTVPKAARQYILTQGPLPTTIGHFWLMVWEQKSNVIVMLNKVLELESFIKCEQYWPSELDSPTKHEGVDLEVTLKSVQVHKHYTVREILLKDLQSGDEEQDDKTSTGKPNSRLILQFHYTAWPDHGEPDSPTSLLRLLTAIRKSGGLDKMDEPTIVHCSAGIGRSGTFCLIDSILSMVENQGSTEGIDIDNTLLEMRDYRGGLIQSSIQLKFAYMSIIYGVKILEKANKLHPHISSIKDNVVQHNDDKPSSSQDQASTQDTGATAQTATRKSAGGAKSKQSRRIKTSKRQSSSSASSNTLNVFKKHLLVEALDDIDSDEADNLFYDTMKPWPSIKKPRNSSPDDDDASDQLTKYVQDLIKNKPIAFQPPPRPSVPKTATASSPTTRAQMYDRAINSLITENVISSVIPDFSQPIASTSSATSSSPPRCQDSAILRRRIEKELKNQKLAEKTLDIKNRMKAEELRRERMTRFWSAFRTVSVGLALGAVSSVVYHYYYK